uniref:Uncharacterized protein n=1 Tax=Arundo donax TaxID=35708 RepID=A0A0A9FDK7_ARUDO
MQFILRIRLLIICFRILPFVIAYAESFRIHNQKLFQTRP